MPTVADFLSNFMEQAETEEAKSQVKQVMTLVDVAMSDPTPVEKLPRTTRLLLDSLAAQLLSPDTSRTLLIGYPFSGKSFLVEQLSYNIDKYLTRSNLDSFHFITLNERDLMELGTTDHLRRHFDSVKQVLQVDDRQLCVLTESIDVAMYVSTTLPKIRVILELNIDAYLALRTMMQKTIAKTWANWNIVDANDVHCSREELVQLLWDTQVRRLNQDSPVKLTKRQVEKFIDTAVDRFQTLERQTLDGDLVITAPPGIWATCLKQVQARAAFTTDPEDLGKSGKPLISKAIAKTLEENWMIFTPFIDRADLLSNSDVPEEFVKIISSELGVMSRGGSNQRQVVQGNVGQIDFSDMSTLENRLKENLMGQDAAVSRVAKSFVVPSMGLNDPDRPVRSFFFLGPTGVGKTQLAINISEQLGKEQLNFVRIDMGEFQESHEASKFYGSPPGYVGHEEGGKLTNAVIENPQSVILLDEVEKAHPKIWDALLQVFDAGRMTDGMGREVDFTQCVLIMTSNIGADKARKPSTGFLTGTEESRYEQRLKDTSNIVQKELKKEFRSEFLNRVDEVVIFNELSQDVLSEIVRKEINKFSKRMKSRGFTLSEPPTNVIESIISKSDISEYGAREIQREVYKNISTPVAEFLSVNPSVKKVSLTAPDEEIIVTNDGKRK